MTLLAGRCAAMVSALSILTLAGCGASGPTDIVSDDGQFQVTVWEGMKKHPDLHEEANIQAANLFKELYVVVLTEPKSDFDAEITVKEYGDFVQEQMATSLSSTPGTGTPTTTAAGQQAVEYQLHGTVDGHKIGYLVTAVDTGEHFHQVLTWTLDEKFNSSLPTLQKIAKSLKSK